MQHILYRKSRANENSHEIYVEIGSCSDEVVEQLRDRLSSDVIVHVTNGVTSSRADNGTTNVHRKVFLDQCTTVKVHWASLVVSYTISAHNHFTSLSSLLFFMFLTV